MSAISVITVRPDSPELQQVIALGDKFRKYLGLFPKEAFAAQAAKGNILAAACNGNVAGYVLFYPTQKGRVRIVHLCVDDPYRRMGIARRLFTSLIELSKDYHSFVLSCRRDYAACSFWPQLGFVVVRTRPGRGDSLTELVIFTFTLPRRTLLDDTPLDTATADIVLDANVFFDLEDPSRAEASETVGLTADWLQPLIRLCVTEELRNELSATSNASQDVARRLAVFHTLESNSVKFLETLPEIVSLFPKARTERENADRRQLARAIASNAVAFVTRDQELLKYADEVYQRFGLRVMRPSTLIGQLDEIQNETEYQRDRLAGTAIRVFRVSQDAGLLARCFFNPMCDNKSADLRRQIDLWFSAPDRFVMNVISEGDQRSPIEEQKPLACLCFERTAAGGLQVVLVRTRPQGELLRQFGTVQRCVLMAILQYAGRCGSWYVDVCDTAGPPELLHRLTELGFHSVSGGYFKLCPRMCGDAADIADVLAQRCADAGVLEKARCVLEALKLLDADVAFEAEKKLWPAKITGVGIRTFVVAIQPRWAKHLIGVGVRDSDLFGADAELAFNFEAVYYRSARRNLVNRSRILWYVSKDSAFRSVSGCVVACSHADMVEIGSAKALFRKNERFGVYHFRDVLETAGGDASNDVMAVRFSGTERLNPVALPAIKTVLSESTRWNNFQAPMEISEEAFVKLYGG